MDTPQERIDMYRQMIENELATQRACKHPWGPTEYNPRNGSKEVFSGRYEDHGVHHYPIMEHIPAKVPRWTRKCTKCGLLQHTEKQREINRAIETEPDFG